MLFTKAVFAILAYLSITIIAALTDLFDRNTVSDPATDLIMASNLAKRQTQ
jgi:hypothetical protein